MKQWYALNVLMCSYTSVTHLSGNRPCLTKVTSLCCSKYFVNFLKINNSETQAFVYRYTIPNIFMSILRHIVYYFQPYFGSLWRNKPPLYYLHFLFRFMGALHGWKQTPILYFICLQETISIIFYAMKIASGTVWSLTCDDLPTNNVCYTIRTKCIFIHVHRLSPTSYLR